MSELEENIIQINYEDVEMVANAIGTVGSKIKEGIESIEKVEYTAKLDTIDKIEKIATDLREIMNLYADLMINNQKMINNIMIIEKRTEEESRIIMSNKMYGFNKFME